MNDELERMWKETVMAGFNMSQHLSRGTEEDQKKSARITEKKSQSG
jgi:hypothetical protein